MARIRSIKPEFWTSEQITRCSPLSRLLFIGLWNFCDDAGIHPASARRLRLEVFPGDDIDDEQIEAMIDELIVVNLVERYEAAGEKYWHVTGWAKHQRIDRPTRRFPPPPNSTSEPRDVAEDDRRLKESIVEQANSTSTRRALDEPSPPDWNRSGSGSGKEDKKDPPSSPSLKRSSASKNSPEVAVEAEVANFLHQTCGIGDHAGAIAAAKSHNVSLAEVRAIAEHGLKHSYSPNLIHARIVAQTPGADVASGWIGQKSPPKPPPDVAPEVKAAEERLASLPFDERINLAREYLGLGTPAYAEYQVKGRDSPHRWKIAKGMAAAG